ncbi:hypothetical protein B0G84_4075 [Paraburkholderia sp. BL8N3]|nr:hypothetical protein B0G84_4075 [Paraburkholderia sp. BL8N3]
MTSTIQRTVCVAPGQLKGPLEHGPATPEGDA